MGSPTLPKKEAFSPSKVCDGLANVLLWGYQTMGYGLIRVEDFLKRVTADHMGSAIELFDDLAKGDRDGLLAIKQLPQFSMVPFASKLRMFLDPAAYVVLDNQLARLSEKSTFFGSGLRKSPRETSIRITHENASFYSRWCGLCRFASARMGDERTPAVEAERAVFHLVRQGRIEEAAGIVDRLAAEAFGSQA
jgi:hypothetical protein